MDKKTMSNMIFKKDFSFSNDNIIKITIDKGVHMCIERTGFAIAHVYFTSDDYAEINIPKGLTIADNTNKCSVKPIVNDLQNFVLCWTDSYTIFYNDEVVIDLVNKRQWSIYGPANVGIKVMDT
jgi:hypothetical protein